jgi:flagellar hook-basal body complex protein FliE
VSIDPISTVAGPALLSGIDPITGSQDAASAAAASGADFGSMLTNGIDALQGLQTKSDNLALRAATGDLTNVQDYVIASTEANLATQLTVSVRDKALDAFNEIMRMQA